MSDSLGVVGNRRSFLTNVWIRIAPLGFLISLFQSSARSLILPAIVMASLDTPERSDGPTTPPSPNMTSSLTGRLAPRLLATIILFSTPARAGLIPADLDFSGFFFWDTFDAVEDGDATQSGTVFSKIGGVTSTTNYSGTGIDSGSNPNGGFPTHHGDGVAQAGDGYGGTASASIAAGTAGSEFFADTDLGEDNYPVPLVINNTSTTQSYKIWMSLMYDHSVEATGSMGYVISDLELKQGHSDLLDREIISDTWLGNEKNGGAFPGFGGEVDDSGLFQFNFTLAPLTQTWVVLDHTLEGLIVPDGDSLTGTASYFLSIDNVTAVPEPSAFLLFGLLLSGGLVRRRPRR